MSVEALPPELLSLVAADLAPTALAALTLSCSRLHNILQPALGAHLFDANTSRKALVWAAGDASRLSTMKMLLAPPYSVNPNEGAWAFSAIPSPLHAAAESNNIEGAKMLLAARPPAALEAMWEEEGFRPLHLAALKRHLEMMELLLLAGAQPDTRWGTDGCQEAALHHACYNGDTAMIELMLKRAAKMECTGHWGTALGFALHGGHYGVAEHLVRRGANPNVTTPLFILMNGGPPRPHVVPLLYFVVRPPHPEHAARAQKKLELCRRTEPWNPLPMEERLRKMLALLIAHGASLTPTIKLLERFLVPLAEAAGYVEPLTKHLSRAEKQKRTQDGGGEGGKQYMELFRQLLGEADEASRIIDVALE